MVETCLPVDDGDNPELSHYPSTLSVSSHLSSSMSSLTSPTEKDGNLSDYHGSCPGSLSATDPRQKRHSAAKQNK